MSQIAHNYTVDFNGHDKLKRNTVFVNTNDIKSKSKLPRYSFVPFEKGAQWRSIPCKRRTHRLRRRFWRTSRTTHPSHRSSSRNGGTL